MRVALTGLAATGIAVAGAAPSIAAQVTPAGQVTGWGRSTEGQTTAPLLDGQKYTAVAAGLLTSFTLTTDGHVRAWGANSFGQVAGAPTGGGYTAIAAGDAHAIAVNAAAAPALTGTPDSAAVGRPYSYTFTVAGYPAPTVSVTAGDLPPGLTLTAADALSGKHARSRGCLIRRRQCLEAARREAN